MHSSSSARSVQKLLHKQRVTAARRAIAPRLLVGTLAIGIALATGLSPASAQTYAYQGQTGTTTTPTTGSFTGGFNDGTNPNVTPASSATTALTFAGATAYTATDDIAGALSLNSLTFNNTAAVTIAATTGNSLNFVANGTTNPTISVLGNTVDTISAPISFSGTTLTFNVNTGTSGKLILNAAGQLTGNGTLNYTGNRILDLTQANSGFTGAITLNGAANAAATSNSVVQVENVGALGSGGVTVNGGTLDLDTGSTSTTTNTLNNSVTLNGGAIGASNQPGTAAFNSVTANSTSSIFLNDFYGNTGRTLQINNLSGSANLNVGYSRSTASGGVLALNGPASNYSGYTGTLIVNNTNSVTIGSTTGNSSFGGNLQLNSAVNLQSAGGGSATFTGNLSGIGNITLSKGGGENVNLNGDGTGYTGTVAITDGNLNLGSANALGAGSVLLGNTAAGNNNTGLLAVGPLTIANNITVQQNTGSSGNATLGGSTLNNSSNTFSGNINLVTTPGTAGATNASKVILRSAQNSGTPPGTTLTTTFSGIISSVAGTASGAAGTPLVQINSPSGGVVALTGANTYIGTTLITDGTLLAGNNSALGASSVLLGNTSGASNVTLLSNGAFNIANNVTVQTGSSGSATIGSNADASPTFSGAVTLNRATSFLSRNTTAGGTVTFSGAIGGSGSVTVTNAANANNSVTFTGNNTYSGGTTVGGGTLVLNSATPNSATGTGGGLNVSNTGVLVLGASDQINDGTSLTLNNGGTVNVNGKNETVNGLTLSGSSPSILDFGADNGAANTFTFTANTLSGTGTLDIANYDGTTMGASGLDKLFFGSSAGLGSGLSQLAFVDPNGFAAGTYAAMQLSTGEVVVGPAAAPEPSQIVSLAIGLLGLGVLGARAWRKKETVA